MSDSAKTLLYWVSNANSNVADNEMEIQHCLACARQWASYIIAGNY